MGVLKAQHEIEMASLQSQAKAQSTSEILKIRQKYIEQEQDSFSQISKLKQAAQETLDQHRQEIDTLMCMIDASEERHKH